MTRPPAVAGRFYSQDSASLHRQIDVLLAEARGEAKMRARACLVPHAGYAYSGRVAGAVYGRVEIPRRVIVVGPRHHARGSVLAVMSEGDWQTPLGLVPVDGMLAREVMRACPALRQDEKAHDGEHSIEVQLPFLRRLQPAVEFVPIVTGAAQYEELETLGQAIAGAMAGRKDVLLVASSDLNHYEPDAVTREKDRKAIACILALDARALFDTVRKEEISMCGYGAAVVMLTAMRELGATRVELVRHATSGDVNGDLEEVVGYAGMIFS